MKNYAVASQETEIERFQNAENAVVIRWTGESKVIETYSRGYGDPMYVGDGMNAARKSLELTCNEWVDLLSVDVEYLEVIDGNLC
jgi:hypothetical protein